MNEQGLKEPTKEELEELEELEKIKVEQQVMEMFARLGGRTLGIKLDGDEKLPRPYHRKNLAGKK